MPPYQWPICLLTTLCLTAPISKLPRTESINLTKSLTCRTLCNHYGLLDMQERFVSYLPLSHVAANIMDIFMATQCLGTVYFANRDALKGTLVSTLKVVTDNNDLLGVIYQCEGGPPHRVLRCAKGVGEGAGEDDPGEEQLGWFWDGFGNLKSSRVAVNIGRRKNAKTHMPQVGKANTGFKKAFGSWAKKTGLEYNKVS